MGTIPPFDPTAYAERGPSESDLDLCNLDRLAAIFEYFEARHSEAKASRREGLVSPPIGFDPIRADQGLARIKATKASVRAVFARKLLAQCGARKGYQVGQVIYRAQPDGLGFERTPIANPPRDEAQS